MESGSQLYNRGEPRILQNSEGFFDSVGGGAWSFLVGGVICLVNSDNKRDPGMLTSYVTPCSQRQTSQRDKWHSAR